jgi:hypothetical protein
MLPWPADVGQHRYKMSCMVPGEDSYPSGNVLLLLVSAPVVGLLGPQSGPQVRASSRDHLRMLASKAA